MGSRDIRIWKGDFRDRSDLKSMHATYSFNVLLSENDLIDVSVEMMQQTTAGRKQSASMKKFARGTAFFALVLTGIIAVKVIGERSHIRDAFADIGVLVLITVLAWALAAVLWRTTRISHIRKSAKRRVQSVAAFCLRRPQIVALSPEGFRSEGDGMITELAWKHFEEVVAGDRYILFAKHDATAHVLPRSVVGDVQAQENLIKQCQTWLAEGGGGASYAVVSLLTDRDLPCPKCEYNLRNQPRPICPECGHTLDQHELYEKLGQLKGS
jgi:hypothetical protein